MKKYYRSSTPKRKHSTKKSVRHISHKKKISQNLRKERIYTPHKKSIKKSPKSKTIKRKSSLKLFIVKKHSSQRKKKIQRKPRKYITKRVVKHGGVKFNTAQLSSLFKRSPGSSSPKFSVTNAIQTFAPQQHKQALTQLWQTKGKQQLLPQIKTQSSGWFGGLFGSQTPPPPPPPPRPT